MNKFTKLLCVINLTHSILLQKYENNKIFFYVYISIDIHPKYFLIQPILQENTRIYFLFQNGCNINQLCFLKADLSPVTNSLSIHEKFSNIKFWKHTISLSLIVCNRKHAVFYSSRRIRLTCLIYI